MTSTIKVDTISENTSANGVAVDGVTLKDGKVTANGGVVVDNFTLDATTLALSSGDFTVDVAGDILLDAGDSDLRILQGGTDYCKITKDGNNTAIKSQISDGDLILRGSDGGSQIDALTFDMSAAGAAAFNSTVTATSFNGIPLFTADNSIYTHDVSGTDNAAAQNAGYGVNALDAITTGDHNSAFGFKALSGNTTGARNVALGRSALEVPDTESDNISIGFNALSGAVAGGEQNIAIGSYALDALTSADSNVAIGYEAGGALTTGGENVIMGSYAVSTGVLTGAQNVVIGRLAGQDLTSASKSTIVCLLYTSPSPRD